MLTIKVPQIQDFPPTVNPLDVQVSFASLHMSLWEKASGNQHENADTPATAMAVSNKAFISDPGVSCLQPASMKPYHAKL